MTRLRHRLARLDARDLAGEGRAAALAALALVLLAGLASPRDRARTLAFLEALGDFGQRRANPPPGPVQ